MNEVVLVCNVNVYLTVLNRTVWIRMTMKVCTTNFIDLEAVLFCWVFTFLNYEVALLISHVAIINIIKRKTYTLLKHEKYCEAESLHSVLNQLLFTHDDQIFACIKRIK